MSLLDSWYICDRVIPPVSCQGLIVSGNTQTVTRRLSEMSEEQLEVQTQTNKEPMPMQCFGYNGCFQESDG